MGGGFGGKETQANQFAALAAIAAKKLNRAVKIRLDRDEDMTATGKRHDFVIDYEVGFDDEGSILGVDYMFARALRLLGRPVGSGRRPRAVPLRQRLFLSGTCRLRSAPLYTNTVSNTAFRGFGGPQGMVGAERVIDEVAYRRSARTRSKSASSISTASDGDATSRPITRRSRTTSSSASSRNWRRAPTMPAAAASDRRLQRQQPHRQARHRADAGQVRHLVHQDRVQPGRRAGACLRRRFGAPEPWRHRDGAGPATSRWRRWWPKSSRSTSTG